MIYPGFIGGSNVLQSPIANCERTVNYYVERAQSEGAKAPAFLFPMPGMMEFLRVTQGPWRALAAQDGRAFGVAGFKLYEIFTDGTVTDRGDVASNTNPATISFNGHGADELFVTSGREGYVLDLTTDVFTYVVSDVDVGGFVDGYFCALDAESSIFKISDLEDGLTWDPSQVLERQTGSDNWKGMAIKNREIWLVGSLTSDVFTNIGAFPFPFAPLPQGLVQVGTPAGFSIAPLGGPGALGWIGSNAQGTGFVVATDGNQTQELSTHSVSRQLQSYGDLSNAFSYSYQYQGHNFFIVNIPDADRTWVYDSSSGLWTERLFWNRTTAQWEAHRGACHCFAFGKHLVGDRSTGVLYEETGDVAVDADGNGMRRERTATHIANEGKNITIDRLRLDMQVGVGEVSGTYTDPKIMMSYSLDGGRTYSNEIMASAGEIGDFSVMPEWRRIGSGRNWVFKTICSAPVPWRINQAWLELRAGRQ